MIAITNGRIISGDDLIDGKCLVIEGEKIVDLCASAPSEAEIIDAHGNFVSPGFIDIHIHGASGYDVMDGEPESIRAISKSIAKHGVTSFVPTTMTSAPENIKKALRAIIDCIKHPGRGAGILGVHLEGPFLNKDFKGAHDSRYIRKPDIDFLIDLVEDDFSHIKCVTIAPELYGATDLIKFLVGHGIAASIGHSGGTYDSIMNAIENGASHSTHLFNAMSPFRHREPGVVGAIFDSRITTEIIADGIHVHYAAIRTALSVKGAHNCALISDAMRACCMEDGTYTLGGQEVFVKDGEARLPGGTLAGSTLTLDTAVRNIMENTTLSITEAVSMATSVPARICRVIDKKGLIKKGYDADIIIFDANIDVKTTIIGGEVYK